MAISSNEVAKELEQFQRDFSQDFVVQCIGDGTYSVLDAGKASFYIVEGFQLEQSPLAGGAIFIPGSAGAALISIKSPIQRRSVL